MNDQGWAGWLPRRRTVTVPCTLEIERTADSFHACAVPEGIDLRPGDKVVVHNAPERLAFGERTVIVMSSKVAQKSYGTEKRYARDRYRSR